MTPEEKLKNLLENCLLEMEHCARERTYPTSVDVEMLRSAFEELKAAPSVAMSVEVGAVSRLTDGMKANFDTLLRAAAGGDLALVLVRRVSDGVEVPVVCATQASGDPEKPLEFVPLAEMPITNPYELYEAP